MIEGRIVKIRPIKEKDLQNLFLLTEMAISKNEFFSSSFESENAFYQKYQNTSFWSEDEKTALILNLKNEIIGMIISTKSKIFDFLDLKYIIFEEKNRAKGFMKESLFLFSNFLFSTRNINRLQIAIPNYHRASIAVAKKCGFIFEGISREALFFYGKYLDLCIYSKLRKDFKTLD